MLREAAEEFLIREFQRKFPRFLEDFLLMLAVANLSTIYAKRATLQVKDMKEAAARRTGGNMTGDATLQQEGAEEVQPVKEGTRMGECVESEGAESEAVEL